jgi:F1F0 ATPase subunit 2
MTIQRTMVNSIPQLLPALVAGLLLGAVFFGGLWWTVRRGLLSTKPAMLFVTSVLLRSAIVVVGFYFVSHGDWRRLCACLAGFLVVRVYATRLIRRPHERQSRDMNGGGI